MQHGGTDEHEAADRDDDREKASIHGGNPMNGGVPQTESQRSDDEANPGDRSAVVAEMRLDALHHRHEEQENTSP